MPDNSLRSEAYEALSGQPLTEVYCVTNWCEWHDLCGKLYQAWIDGKKLQITVQEVPK